MRKARFTEHQIIAVLKSVEAGRTVKDVCREADISEASYYIYGLPPFCKY
nr:Transposase, IS3/IS911 family [Morganella morganii]